MTLSSRLSPRQRFMPALPLTNFWASGPQSPPGMSVELHQARKGVARLLPMPAGAATPGIMLAAGWPRKLSKAQ